jgi:hypothetical protein
VGTLLHQAINFLYLLWLGFRDRWARVVLSVLALAFATAINVIAFTLGFGTVRQAVRHAEELFPRGLLTVRPKAVTLLAFQVNASRLDDSAVERISHLDGVDFVAPQLSLKMPLRAEGQIMGQSATSDVVVVGIDEKLVAADVADGYKFTFDEATSLPIPCVIPRFFLDMYNLAYADSLGLPKISEGYPIGKSFSLVVGETYLFGGAPGKSATLPCQVVGLTRQTPLMVGILIPLRHAKALNTWFQGKLSTEYDLLHVKLRDLKKHEQITSAIRAMGFAVDSQDEALDKFLLVVRATGIGITAFMALIVTLAAITLFSTFSLALMLRQDELVILQAVGATRRYIRRLIWADALVVGAMGGILGGVLAWGSMRWLEVSIHRFISELIGGSVTVGWGGIPTLLFCTVLGIGVAAVTVTPLVWRLPVSVYGASNSAS